MEKSFETRRNVFVSDCINNLMFINRVTNTFRFPNINHKQILDILSSPDTEAELELANAILNLSKFLGEHEDIFKGNSYFNPINNSGYEFIDYGISYIFEEIKDANTRYNLTTAEGQTMFLSEVNNAVLSVANDAREELHDKYSQICFDVNLLSIYPYTIEAMKKLLENNNVIEFGKDDDLLSTKMLIAANVAYLTQALYIGDKYNDVGSKYDLSADDLDQATKFTESFTDYIKSLQSFTRN